MLLNNHMEAVILAAGLGKRMKPLSYALPKPLLRLGDRAIIDHIIEWLKANGILKIHIVLSNFGRIIEIYLKGKENLNFIYARPMGTAGQLAFVKDHINGTFAVCYADQYFNFKLREMIEFHKERKSVFTIALFKKKIPIQYGIITHDRGGRVKRWDEKPLIDIKICGGIFIAEKEIFDYIPSNNILQMNELVMKLIKNNLPVYAYSVEGEFYDLGNMEEYERLNKIFEEALGNV